MKNTNSKKISILVLITSIESAILIAYLLLLPSSGTFLFGYSFLRILQLIIILLFSGFEITFFLKKKFSGYLWKYQISHLDNKLLNKKFGFLLVYSLECILLLLILTPSYRFESFQYYFTRLKPLLILFFIFTIKILTLLNISRNNKNRKYNLQNLFIPLSLLSLLLFSFLSGIGWEPDGYWKQPGIPLLISDIVIIFLIYIFSIALLSSSKLNQKVESLQKFDLIIASAIWIFTIIIWASTPIYENSFISSPTPPANDYFPLSDAQFYDLDSLSLLSGGTLGVSGYADKPLYSFFLYLLHLSNQNGSYLNLSTLQLILFAGTTVLFYYLGGISVNRKSGILLALLGVAYGKSLLQTTWIILSGSPRIFSTAFPSLIMLCILLIITIRWTQNKNKIYLLFILGGFSGLSTLLRYNFWILFPTFILFIAIVSKNKHRLWAPLIFLFAFTLSIAPWQIRSEKVIGTPTYFVDRFVYVVWKGRFSNQNIILLNPTPNEILEKSEIIFEWLPLVNVNNYTLVLYTQDGQVQEKYLIEDTSHCSAASCQYKILLDDGNYAWNVESVNYVGANFTSDQIKFTITNQESSTRESVNNFCRRDSLAFSLIHLSNNNCYSKYPAFIKTVNLIRPVLNNTTHNLIAPLFTFPTTIINHNHRNLMYKNDSVWWTGMENIRFSQWAMLFVNLYICVQGYKTLRVNNNNVIAITPLLLYFAYSIGLAIARTSGGRYIIPLTIIPLLYWSIGMSKIFNRLFQKNNLPKQNNMEEPENTLLSKKMKYVLAFLLVMIPAFSLIAFETYPTEIITIEQQSAMFKGITSRLDTELAEKQLNQLIRDSINSDPNILQYGYVFYPIYLEADNHGKWSQSIYQIKDYPRLTFTILNDQGKFYTEFKTDNSANIQHGQLIAYISCPYPKHQDIIALFTFEGNQLKDIVLKNNLSFPLICKQE